MIVLFIYLFHEMKSIVLIHANHMPDIYYMYIYIYIYIHTQFFEATYFRTSE